MNNTTADTPLFYVKMEDEVINSFLPDLVTAVSDSVLSVSDQCLAKGLINETVYKRVLESGGTSEDKARTLILAVKKSTETDSRCLEILLNILEQELPFAIRENLLSKIRKELTEKALLGRFEDSIRQHEHACAEKKLLEERLKVKSEKCERLKGELETLKGQNEELASNTQSRITACTKQIENLEKRIEKLHKTVEEQGMQTRRGRNMVVTNTEKMFVHLEHQTLRIKDREHKLLVQEKELRIRELEAESKQQKKFTHSAEVTPNDMLNKEHLHILFLSIHSKDSGQNCMSQRRDIGSQLGFSTQELDDIQELQSIKDSKPYYSKETQKV